MSERVPKTHCIRGHEFSGHNLITLEYTDREGKVKKQRNCRACQYEGVKRYKERRGNPSYPVSVESKKCFSCGEVKPAKKFYRNQYITDGLTTFCMACYRSSHSKYKNSPERIATLRENAAKSRGVPELYKKTKAREKLRYFVDMGRIKRPSRCDRCKRAAIRIDGHHTDYSKPLDVDWLCGLCHKLAHGKLVDEDLISIVSKISKGKGEDNEA